MESKALALQEHMQLGDVFYKSGLFADLKSAAQAIVKIQAGAELGIPPFAAMSGISIIQGKPALGASLIAGLIKSSHKYDYRVTRHDTTGCTIEFYEGETKLGESSFTAEDAKRAGLLGKDIWNKYPRNMMFSRAMSNGARWYTPDLFTGPIYTPEELDGTALEADYRVVEEPASKAEAPKAEPTPAPKAAPTNGDAQHWFDVGTTNKGVAVWLRDTYHVTIDTVHDLGKKMHDFPTKLAFMDWCKANLVAPTADRAEVEQLAAEIGGVVK
jgi:hypothetical protein